MPQAWNCRPRGSAGTEGAATVAKAGQETAFTCLCTGRVDPVLSMAMPQDTTSLLRSQERHHSMHPWRTSRFRPAWSCDKAWSSREMLQRRHPGAGNRATCPASVDGAFVLSRATPAPPWDLPNHRGVLLQAKRGVSKHNHEDHRGF